MTWKSLDLPSGAVWALVDDGGKAVGMLSWSSTNGSYVDRDGHRLHPNFNKAKEMCEKAATRGQ